MNKAEILIIDDEAQIRKLLEITLQSNSYAVNQAENAKNGLITAENHPPDMIILDLGLPDEDGQSVLQNLREWYTNPILILSVKNNEKDIIEALDNGANDYLVKPFRTGELLARIRSAFRKADSEPNMPTINFRDLSIDFANRIVKKNDLTIKLTATEYSLLSVLARNEGKALTHQYLLHQVWGAS